MSIRVIAVAVLLAGGLSGSPAFAADCKKNAAGAPTVTGSGNADAKAENAGKRRLGAERGALLDALRQIKSCLGDNAGKVTGWSITDVRYFDADPVVEMDVTASFEASPRVTVLGSGLPDLKKAALTGNTGHARVQTTRAAVLSAQRNAKEALDAAFPSEGSGGELKQTIVGSLGGCSTDLVSYWDDQAVTVRLTCGKDVEKGSEPEPKDAPKVEKRK
jgi:hypothetical protein